MASSRRVKGEIEGLYRKRYGKFLRVARAILVDDGRARDAVQDGFANALRAADRFEGTAVEAEAAKVSAG